MSNYLSSQNGFINNGEATTSAPFNTSTAEVLLISSAVAETKNFTVPSGYTSFRVELVGGKGGDYDWTDGNYDYGGLGAKVTFIVPIADMAVGSSQSYTVGVNGANGIYPSSLSGRGGNTAFKGMTAGGGHGAIESFPTVDGSNGTASGTTYTNTTPNQWSSPASFKLYGTPVSPPSTVTKYDRVRYLSSQNGYFVTKTGASITLTGQDCVGTATSSNGVIVKNYTLIGQDCTGNATSSNGTWIDNNFVSRGGFYSSKKKPTVPTWIKKRDDVRESVEKSFSKVIDENHAPEPELEPKIVEREKIIIQRDESVELTLKQHINELQNIIIQQQKQIDELTDENQSLLLLL